MKTKQHIALYEAVENAISLYQWALSRYMLESGQEQDRFDQLVTANQKLEDSIKKFDKHCGTMPIRRERLWLLASYAEHYAEARQLA